MLQFLQMNAGTIIASLAVALLVFLAVRRMVLDKKAGIGACGQKCSQCAMRGHCEEEAPAEKPPVQQDSLCSGNCRSCPHSSTCQH